MQPKWTKQQIRQARKSQLMPILVERSYRLYPLGNDNYRILPDPDDPDAPAGVIVKRSFWIWNERHMAGNSIDFFVKVEGSSFDQAMRIIQNNGRIEPNDPRKWAVPVRALAHNTDDAGNCLRQQCGNQTEIH